ncbi:beta-2-microglobulin-like [Aulostomus maculatus]
MRSLLSVAVLAAVFFTVESKHSPPKVQVYSTQRAEFGRDNTLMCLVTNFHPPDLTIQLMRNGKPLTGAEQSDLSFKEDWHFHLSQNVPFVPMKGEEYSCRVTHGADTRDYAWVPNM